MKIYAMMFNEDVKYVNTSEDAVIKCVIHQRMIFDHPRYTGPRYIVWVKEYDATPAEV